MISNTFPYVPVNDPYFNFYSHMDQVIVVAYINEKFYGPSGRAMKTLYGDHEYGDHKVYGAAAFLNSFATSEYGF